MFLCIARTRLSTRVAVVGVGGVLAGFGGFDSVQRDTWYVFFRLCYTWYVLSSGLEEYVSTLQ